MAATDEMIDFAAKLRPHFVTLVPEKREELTTEGGLNVLALKQSLKDKIYKLKQNEVNVSLFVEPDQNIIDTCAELGAAALEFHTGRICEALEKAGRTEQKWAAMSSLVKLERQVRASGMQFHIGHGINYENATWFQTVPGIEEANIGHAIVARSIFTGFQAAVREMKNLLNDPKNNPRPSV